MKKLIQMISQIAKESTFIGHQVIFNKDFLSMADQVIFYAEKEFPSLNISFDDDGFVSLEQNGFSKRVHLKQFLTINTSKLKSTKSLLLL